MPTNVAALHHFTGRAETRNAGSGLAYVLIFPAIGCAVSLICAVTSSTFAAIVETMGLY